MLTTELHHHYLLHGNEVSPSTPLTLHNLPYVDQQEIQDKEHQAVFKATQQDLFRSQGIHPSRKAKGLRRIFRPDDWKTYWTKASETTSSSESGLHFGHYKAACSSEYLNHFHAAKATTAVSLGTPYDRWKRGVTVMLEKELGVNVVSKLRAILLMEADFNTTNKMIFGNRMLYNVRQHAMMPDEIFSECGRTPVDGTMAKILFHDISRQFCQPAAIASVDASNCFDRICHAIASLVFQATGVPPPAVASMLRAIEEMKFFLRTAFGDSTTFAGGGVEYKTQGMCQGNGAAPAAWGVVSITIINAHKRQHSGATFLCPISAIKRAVAGVLFVDNTDLMHLDMSQQVTYEEVHYEMKSSIHNWGGLLGATGGALKPEKCAYTLIGYEGQENGTWKYLDFSDDDDFRMTVPVPGGGFRQIKHLPVTTAQKTLGIFTQPDGNGTAQLDYMQRQAQTWVDGIKNGKIPQRLVWLGISTQMWPKVGYGIACNASSFNDLSNVLRKQYFQLLPMCEVNRNIRYDFRQLPSEFFGIGLPHPGIEATIASLNLLLQHFGCDSLLGTQLKASYEAFLLELGISPEPFTASYGKYSYLCTHSWLKAVWERCWLFQIHIYIPPPSGPLPRQRDKFFMEAVLTCGLSPEEVKAINRVRIHQQVLLLSDVIAANGKGVDEKYRTLRHPIESWSIYHWPHVYPT